MNVTPDLDARFRDAALREGTRRRPLRPRRLAGRRAVRRRDRPRARRISYRPDGMEETLARTFGARVLRSPLDEVRRELDEYFEGSRREFDLPLDLRVAPFHADVLARARARPVRAHRRPTARSPPRSAARRPPAQSER